MYVVRNIILLITFHCTPEGRHNMEPFIRYSNISELLYTIQYNRAIIYPSDRIMIFSHLPLACARLSDSLNMCPLAISRLNKLVSRHKQLTPQQSTRLYHRIHTIHNSLYPQIISRLISHARKESATRPSNNGTQKINPT